MNNTPYIALIKPGPNGYIRTREPFGWSDLVPGEQLQLPEGYVIMHEQDADTERAVNGWGLGLAVMGIFLAMSVLSAVWQLGAQH